MEKFKRKVFYLSGFDPRGVRFYRGLYREAVERYAALSGERVIVGPRRPGPASSMQWSVTNESAGVETDYEFLRWEDLAAKVWIKNPLMLGLRSIATYVGHARFMDFRRMRKLREGPVVTILYPGLLAVLIPLLLFLLPALLLSIALPWWVGVLAGIALSALLSGRLLNKLIVPWLLRFHYYHHRLAADGPSPDLSERLDLFARRIVEEMDGPYDEVLLMTHSAGTIQAMSLMRRIAALRPDLPDHFALVGLGQVVPVVALRSDACWYHDDLRAIGDLPFRYVDFSFPPDGAAYFDVNPLLLMRSTYAARVDMLSPRFHLFYDPGNYHGGMANKYELHFDYLRVGDRLSPVDYGSLTAGPRRLEESIALFRTLP